MNIRLFSQAGWITPLVTLLLFFSSQVFAEFSGRLHVSNNRIFRGLEVSDRGMVPDANLKYSSSSGWYIGANASNAEFSPQVSKTELNMFLGYAWRLSDDTNLDMALVDYRYPDLNLQRDYKWKELQVKLRFQSNLNITLGIAENWLASNNTSSHLELSYVYGLSENFNLQLTTGAAKSSKVLSKNYLYTELGLLYALGSSSYLRLNAHRTMDNLDIPFNERAGQHFSIGAGYLF